MTGPEHTPADSASERSAEISAPDAMASSAAGSATLIDVREADEWALGHSPLAVSLPMSELRDRLGEVPGDRPVLVVCHSGQRSARVAAALVDAGYDAVNVTGGMIAWSAAGGEVVAMDGSAPRVD